MPPPIATLNPFNSPLSPTIAIKPRSLANTSTSFVGGTATAILNYAPFNHQMIRRASQEDGYLSRKVELAIQGFKVLEGFTSNEFLVKPNLVVGSCPRNEMAADFLCEVEDLLMQLRHGGNRRADDIPEGTISYNERVQIQYTHLFTSPQAARVSRRTRLISWMAGFK